MPPAQEQSAEWLSKYASIAPDPVVCLPTNFRGSLLLTQPSGNVNIRYQDQSGIHAIPIPQALLRQRAPLLLPYLLQSDAFFQPSERFPTARETIHIFVFWIYTGRLPDTYSDPQVPGNTATTEPVLPWLQAWLFSDQYFIPDFQALLATRINSLLPIFNTQDFKFVHSNVPAAAEERKRFQSQLVRPANLAMVRLFSLRVLTSADSIIWYVRLALKTA